MTFYVLGFAISEFNEVVLIQKDRPTAMAGKWNGIGGKVEAGETIEQAMVREFREETGVVTAESAWTLRAVLHDDGSTIYTFLGTGIDIDRCETMETEEVDIFDVGYLPGSVMPNLNWLLTFAIEYTGVKPMYMDFS